MFGKDKKGAWHLFGATVVFTLLLKIAIASGVEIVSTCPMQHPHRSTTTRG